MIVWLFDFICRLLVCFALIVVLAVLLAAIDCRDNRQKPVKQPVAQDLFEANQCWLLVYGRMSNQEKIAAVVLEW